MTCKKRSLQLRTPLSSAFIVFSHLPTIPVPINATEWISLLRIQLITHVYNSLATLHLEEKENQMAEKRE